MAWFKGALERAAGSWQLQERIDSLGQASDALGLQHKIAKATERASLRIQQQVHTTIFGFDLESQFRQEVQSITGITTVGAEAAATITLRRWACRLANGSGPTPDAARCALFQSGALEAALETVLQSEVLRRALIPLDTGQRENTGLRAELLSVLELTSNMPADALQTLLDLLVEAYDHVNSDPDCAFGASATDDAADATIRWLRALLSACFMRGQEAELLGRAALARAAQRALEAFAAESGRRRGVPLAPGTKVWAASLGAFDARGAPPMDTTVQPPTSWRLACVIGAGEIDTCSRAGGHGVAIEWIVEAAPAEVGADPLNGADCRINRECICNANHMVPAGITSGFVEEINQVVTNFAIADVPHGEHAPTTACSKGLAQMWDEWAKAGAVGAELRSLFVECGNDCAQNREYQMRCHTPHTLQALREEREARSCDLGGRVKMKTEAMNMYQGQVKESSDSFSDELDTMRERKLANDKLLSQLINEKRALLAVMHELDCKLEQAEQAARELRADELRLNENMRNVSSELSSWLSREGSQHEEALTELRFLQAAAQVAVHIESVVAQHAAASASAERDCAQLECLAPALAAACLEAERERLVLFSKLAVATTQSPQLAVCQTDGQASGGVHLMFEPLDSASAQLRDLSAAVGGYLQGAPRSVNDISRSGGGLSDDVGELCRVYGSIREVLEQAALVNERDRREGGPKVASNLPGRCPSVVSAALSAGTAALASTASHIGRHAGDGAEKTARGLPLLEDVTGDVAEDAAE